MIAAVTFDCWGTLIFDRDMSRAFERRVQAIAELADGRLDEAAARDLLDRAWRRHFDAWRAGQQYGSPGMAAFVVSALGLPAERAGELAERFEEASADGDVAEVPGAAATLAALRSAGVRTALVCDTGFTPGRLVRGFLADLGLDRHLEYLAFSDEVGVPKPHPRIFRRALDALGVPPRAAVHVGDLRRTDVGGAHGVGMRAVRITAVYDDPEGPEAEVVVASHAELPAALRLLGAPL